MSNKNHQKIKQNTRPGSDEKALVGGTMTVSNDTNQEHSFIGFKSESLDKTRQDELQTLKEANSLIKMILAEIHDIGELLGHRKISKVENLKERLEKHYRKIAEYLNRPQGEITAELSAGRAQKQSLPVEEHPLLPKLGGMPLDIDSADLDFIREMGIDPKLDKAEIQNQIKNKLQAKLKMTRDLANRLQRKLVNKPQHRPTNKMLMNYKKMLKEAPVLKPLAPAPAPRRERPPPRPTPFG